MRHRRLSAGAKTRISIARVRVSREPRPPSPVLGELRQVLEQTAQQGYAIEKDETDVGVTCIGSRHLSGAGLPIAALSLSVPSVRSNERNEQSLIAAVRDGAKEITNCLTADTSTESL